MNPDDQELQDLEQYLKQISPAEPGAALTARIFSAFELPADAAPAEIADSLPRSPRPRPWSQPIAAAAAVALIAGVFVIIGLNRPGSQSGSETAKGSSAVTIDNPLPANFVPSHAQNTYQGSALDDIIFTEDGRPVQVVRHQFMDSYTWVNPVDGSRVEIRFPVERIRYLPVPTD